MVNLDVLERRLNDVDIQQIQLLLRVPPAQRLKTMLTMQSMVLNMWRGRLGKSHPQLNDLDLTRLVFRRLKHGDDA